MPSRCECGHNQSRHEIRGFDGECIGESCHCKSFRPVERARAVAALPVGRPEPTRLTVEQLLRLASASGDRRTVALAGKVARAVGELRTMLAALRVARLTPGRAPLVNGSGEHLCGAPDCDRTFPSAQGLSLHRRRAHEGFDPHAAVIAIHESSTIERETTP